MMKIKNAELMENIGKIVFYNNGEKVVIESHQADNSVYILNDKNVFNIDYMHKVVSMDAGAEFKRAVKENLNRKDNYYMTYLPDYSSYKRVALYIYADFEITEVIDHVWDNETAYINAVTVKLPFVYDEITREEFPYDQSFKLPEGAKWALENSYTGPNTYKVIDLDVDSLEYKRRVAAGLPTKYINHLIRTEVLTNNHTFKVGPYTRIEYSDHFNNCIQLAQEFSNILNDKYKISRYDMQKLLANYDITRKAGC